MATRTPPTQLGIPCLLLALLVACATQTPYAPAEERGAPGYTETKLTSNRYRITFTGNSSTPAETVKDYALLRAAELTLQEGHDWFQLADRETDKKVQSTTAGGAGFVVPGHTTVYQQCGVLGCDTAVVSEPGFSTGVGAGTTSSRSSYTSSLEIVLGKNPRPSSVQAYDARQLASTLRARLNESR